MSDRAIDTDRLTQSIVDHLATAGANAAKLSNLLKRAEAERDALRLALEPLERAVNESVSGVRKVDIPEWQRLLAAAQAALESKAE